MISAIAGLSVKTDVLHFVPTATEDLSLDMMTADSHVLDFA